MRGTMTRRLVSPGPALRCSPGAHRLGATASSPQGSARHRHRLGHRRRVGARVAGGIAERRARGGDHHRRQHARAREGGLQAPARRRPRRRACGGGTADGASKPVRLSVQLGRRLHRQAARLHCRRRLHRRHAAESTPARSRSSPSGRCRTSPTRSGRSRGSASSRSGSC